MTAAAFSLSLSQLSAGLLPCVNCLRLPASPPSPKPPLNLSSALLCAPTISWLAMAANGHDPIHLACKCLNIRIHAQPTKDTPPQVEAGFNAIYVGEEGIRVVSGALRTSLR